MSRQATLGTASDRRVAGSPSESPHPGQPEIRRLAGLHMTIEHFVLCIVHEASMYSS